MELTIHIMQGLRGGEWSDQYRIQQCGEIPYKLAPELLQSSEVAFAGGLSGC